MLQKPPKIKIAWSRRVQGSLILLNSVISACQKGSGWAMVDALIYQALFGLSGSWGGWGTGAGGSMKPKWILQCFGLKIWGPKWLPTLFWGFLAISTV